MPNVRWTRCWPGRFLSPPASLAGLGEPRVAGLNVLYRADDLTILNVVWAPLMLLLPHNHNMWASIGIYTGREDNIIWEQHRSAVKAFAPLHCPKRRCSRCRKTRSTP